MHEVAQEMGSGLKVYRVNMSENVMTAVRLGVTALPQILLFVEGRETSRSVGFVPKGRILAMLETP